MTIACRQDAAQVRLDVNSLRNVVAGQVYHLRALVEGKIRRSRTIPNPFDDGKRRNGLLVKPVDPRSPALRTTHSWDIIDHYSIGTRYWYAKLDAQGGIVTRRRAVKKQIGLAYYYMDEAAGDVVVTGRPYWDIQMEGIRHTEVPLALDALDDALARGTRLGDGITTSPVGYWWEELKARHIRIVDWHCKLTLSGYSRSTESLVLWRTLPVQSILAYKMVMDAYLDHYLMARNNYLAIYRMLLREAQRRIRRREFDPAHYPTEEYLLDMTRMDYEISPLQDPNRL